VDEGFLDGCNMRTQRSGMTHDATTGARCFLIGIRPNSYTRMLCGGLTGVSTRRFK